MKHYRRILWVSAVCFALCLLGLGAHGGLLAQDPNAQDLTSATWKLPKKHCLIHFIDVGQGDATLLEFPCGAVLIDAGGDRKHCEKLVPHLKGFFNRRTDLKKNGKGVLER